MYHTELLLLIFIAFRVPDRVVNCGQSKRVIQIDEFERLNCWEGRDIDISISSKKVKITLPENYSQYHVVYI
jgi:NAD kinase